MPIPHKYVNASDNIAQYRADQCGRQAITVAEYFDHDWMADLTVYSFSVEDDEMGLDPWRIVDLDRYMPGREPNPDKPYIMSNASGTRSWDVAGDRVVFVSAAKLMAAKSWATRRDE